MCSEVINIVLLSLYSNFRTFLKDNNRLPEILFTGHHVTHLPWGMYNDWDNIECLGNITELPFQNVHISAKKLRHITHIEPAKEINRDQNYLEFKPARKVGKYTIGGTYAICEPINQSTPPTGETKYQRVTSDEELFPGYYSWWSIDNDPPSPSNPPPPSSNPPSSSDPLPSTSDSPPSPLEKYYYFSQVFTQSSRYGNNKFSGNIIDLLQCYRKAYDVYPLPRIQFRCGGTLRYKQEICKVVIVCTNAYPLPEDKFPVMWEGARIERVGEITLTITTLIENLEFEVVIRNGITGAKTDPEYTPYSWDTYAFGFYFPDETYRLKCPESVIQHSVVGHDVDSCVKKQRGICPDGISSVT